MKNNILLRSQFIRIYTLSILSNSFCAFISSTPSKASLSKISCADGRKLKSCSSVFAIRSSERVEIGSDITLKNLALSSVYIR